MLNFEQEPQSSQTEDRAEKKEFEPKLIHPEESAQNNKEVVGFAEEEEISAEGRAMMERARQDHLIQTGEEPSQAWLDDVGMRFDEEKQYRSALDNAA